MAITEQLPGRRPPAPAEFSASGQLELDRVAYQSPMSIDQVREHTTPTEVPMDVACELMVALEHALALNGRRVHRLGAARTSVTYEILDEAGGTVTLLLDRHPPIVVKVAQPAEITIGLTTAQAVSFIRGEMIIPNELLAGTVTARGPVRRYLRVDPILRGLLVQLPRVGE